MKTDLELLLDQLENDSIEAYQKRLKLNPDNPYQDWQRGLYQGEQLAFDSAIRMVKSILERHQEPKFEDVFSHLKIEDGRIKYE